jgi:hypothetical protein
MFKQLYFYKISKTQVIYSKSVKTTVSFHFEFPY